MGISNSGMQAALLDLQGFKNFLEKAGVELLPLKDYELIRYKAYNSAVMNRLYKRAKGTLTFTNQTREHYRAFKAGNLAGVVPAHAGLVTVNKMPAKKLPVPKGVRPPKCLHCTEKPQLVRGLAVYPHRPDLDHKHFWLCPCGAYCGCHPKTAKALGTPCNAQTRKARSVTHAVFDPLWRKGSWSRSEAYSWLAKALNEDPSKVHIGMFTETRCQLVQALVTDYLAQQPVLGDDYVPWE